MAKGTKVKNGDGQRDEFIDAARALGCDESEERFDAALKKAATHKAEPVKKKVKGSADEKPDV
jgi:hypothetical protein